MTMSIKAKEFIDDCDISTSIEYHLDAWDMYEQGEYEDANAHFADAQFRLLVAIMKKLRK